MVRPEVRALEVRANAPHVAVAGVEVVSQLKLQQNLEREQNDVMVWLDLHGSCHGHCTQKEKDK